MKKGHNKFHALRFFLYKYRKIYVSLFIATLGYTALESVNISLFLPLLNSVLGKDMGSVYKFTLLEKLVSLLPFNDRFISICILAILILVIKEFLGFVRHALIGYGVGKVVADAKEEIFKKYICSDYQFFLDNKQGKLMYNLLNGTGRLGNCLQYFPEIITSALMTVTIGFLLLQISLPVTLFLSIVGIAFNFIMHKLSMQVSYHIGTERIAVSARAHVISNEVFDGIKHIKVFNASDFWQKNFIAAVRRFKQLVISDYRWIVVPEIMMNLLPVAGLAVAAVFFRYYGKLSLEFITANFAVIGVYVYAFYRLVPFLASFGRLRMQIMSVLPDVEMVYEIISKSNDLDGIKDGKIEKEGLDKAITFKNVYFCYKGNASNVLDGVTFTIEKGKTTAIVGTSGSGKTTLINLMVRLFLPSAGTIYLDGIDLREIKYSSLAKIVGLVSQDTFIFNATIRENIIFGLKDVSDAKLHAVTQLAHAHDFIMHFPSGYDTLVGDKGFKLSGGQRQRIAIARAILHNPEVLLLDEATSSLDRHSEMLVQSAINEIAKNKTVVAIAHRFSTILNADKIIVLDKGKVAEEGKHHELMAKKGIYFSLYEAQQVRSLRGQEMLL